MLSTQDIQRHIRSISGTAKITGAMQMVAASKMRRAQQAALAGRPFINLLYRVQRAATSHTADVSHPLLQVREVRNRAVILVAADKGLCGALNGNVFRLAEQFEPSSRGYITVGRMATQFVARSGRQERESSRAEASAINRARQNKLDLAKRFPSVHGTGGFFVCR